MLAKANRLLKADDFRTTMRSGRKVSSANFVLYLKRDLGNPQARFGFVVAKTVGNAVTRNLVKRRLRVLARQHLPLISEPIDIVVRALPTIAALDWNKLSTEFETAFIKGLAKGIQA
jgi:ribonuclease P protein component